MSAPLTVSLVAERLRQAWEGVAAEDPEAPVDLLADLDLEATWALPDGDGVSRLDERFTALCDRLGLDALDCALLALAALPDLHPACAYACAYLHEEPSRRRVSPRLAGRLLAGEELTDAVVLQRLDLGATLRRTGALRLQTDGPVLDGALAPAPAVVEVLLGTRLALPDGLRRVDPAALPLGREATRDRLRAVLGGDRELGLVVTGADAPALLAEAGAGLVILDASQAEDLELGLELGLVAALEDRLPAVDGFGELAPERRRAVLSAAQALPCRPVFLATGRDDALVLADVALLQVDVPPPGVQERAAAWRAATGLDDVGEVPARFRLDVGRIGEAAAVARAEAATRGDDLDPGLLALGARLASSRRIGEIAERMVPGPGWGELVLPTRQLRALQALVAFLGHREQVLTAWGFDRIAGRSGYVALFAGESGTGKTLSARVVAGEAGLDVYRVDLAQLFSKWVGETEKNLDRVFSAAAGSNAVLFFDEADVVFGKRSATSSSSDRYANLETAYLLQRIEAYEGVVVLATNLRSSIDPAFVRRLDVVVDFPPPDAEVRRALWERLIPAGAPRAEDLELDFLAERFELSGGGIRNCTVTAAFLAAEAGREIRTTDLVRAIAIEFEKQGRLVVEADFERFHGAL